MRVRAIQIFIDKKEGVARKVGDTFNLSKERLEEVNSTKFGALVEVVAEETTKPDDRMTKGELIEYAKKKGIELSESMTKKEMLEEIGG
ncbi:hypothetical protein A7W90_16205 [Clostridium sp. Bc-iso-3]|nr:hypothetical protein A7W90_16205 [Clostridium sp. Bc-iso-3]